ncbi:type II toxin-antitoxin system HicA family toxin [Algoriphagus sp.]|uniref:type II toxin-antitoxin system HicA family toxin n=1 Tax=Algoriphagus sp. TaxID=1872435 RepID=UPI0027193CA4|nr:type II toxin-antitoxin system HicA family toxin [Algoriphagus sp.]MDO8966820.1 type II toxin-antitoxin system HicA family toxin [Algoriphagus sp.]MDP3199857.1 type II toxin-antitoxin system HicA family toxin [Algoriphagus sp.]
MAKLDKLKARLLQKPKDFRYEELETLLLGLGYEEKNTGKTAGSRRLFINIQTKSIIRLHKPHPSSILKTYVILDVINILTKEELL